MFESIYVGLSGLMGFSKGLNVLSNNVANLNTPGFKSSQLQFQDLFYQLQGTGGENSAQIGTGLDTGTTSLNLKQGELRETGNDLDLAIDGNGFFVLRKDNQTYYTRAGQFEFDTEGYLIERSNKARVAGLGNGDKLQDITINGLRTNPPEATGSITFTGNLSSGDTQHVINNVKVYDSAGSSQTLDLTFDNNGSNVAGSWNITIKDSTGTVATGQILFSNGTPVAGSDSLTFTYAPPGAPPSTIKLDFGKDVTAYSAGSDSSLKVNTQDGYAPGALTKASFDSEGYLALSYSNNQTAKGPRLALAWFDFIQGLELDGGNMFVNKAGLTPQIGGAAQSVFGSIKAGSIEISNVDLTQQFSDLIITQRGYQASSQVISAANEMMQQLFDLKARR